MEFRNRLGNSVDGREISESFSSEILKQVKANGSVNHRLEALKILSESIVREVNNLQREENFTEIECINLSEEVQNYEAGLIRCALLRCNGRQRRAARLLGVKITTLNAKIKRLGIEITLSDSKTQF